MRRLRYTETLHLPSTELEQLIKSCFKHTISDPETRNQLLWGDRDMTLSQMIEKAQRFKGFKGAESVKVKTTLRTTETSSVMDQLKSELAELRKQMAILQASPKEELHLLELWWTGAYSKTLQEA